MSYVKTNVASYSLQDQGGELRLDQGGELRLDQGGELQ